MGRAGSIPSKVSVPTPLSFDMKDEAAPDELGIEVSGTVALSFIVLIALVALGLAVGVAIVYYWDDITTLFG